MSDGHNDANDANGANGSGDLFYTEALVRGFMIPRTSWRTRREKQAQDNGLTGDAEDMIGPGDPEYADALAAWEEWRAEQEMLRAEAEEALAEENERRTLDRLMKEAEAPYGGRVLVLDTETTTDPAQHLRYGFAMLWGLSRRERIDLYHRYAAGRIPYDQYRARLDTEQRPICSWGFYDPDHMSADEVATFKMFCAQRGVVCLRRDQFIQVFYDQAYKYQALVVMHNAPFDLSRSSRRDMGQAVLAGGRFANGFRFGLCDCQCPEHGVAFWNCSHKNSFKHPAVRVKMLKRFVARIAFEASYRKKDASVREKERASYPGKFVDTATLAIALLDVKSPTLEYLGDLLNTVHRKLERPTHDGPLTIGDLKYALNDVCVTFEVYQKLRDLYRQHGVYQVGDRSTHLPAIVSEASLGKAYLKRLGIPPFLRAHPEIPLERIGQAMQAFYAGRSEVKIRLQPTEINLFDFKQQYPTVAALMRLHDLLVARRVLIRDTTDEVRQLLNVKSDALIEVLHDPGFWPRLRGYVKVRLKTLPGYDVFPVRARYTPEQSNIGLNQVSGAYPGITVWYPLADCCASVLKTGWAPDVIEAWEIAPDPEARTYKVAEIDILGDPAFHYDGQGDFFVRMVEMRDEVKRRQKSAPPDEQEYLENLQAALKKVSTSTSYGALVQVNEREPTKPKRVRVVSGDHVLRPKVERREEIGPFFAGPLGPLIPAGGRLLLAIGEYLAQQRGLSLAMCDTDSLALANVDGRLHADIWQACDEVADWFTALSPYQGQPAILKSEDVNYAPILPDDPCYDPEHPNRVASARREPLYFLGISSKRYDMYNRADDGTFRLRKLSLHGLGGYPNVSDYQTAPQMAIPEPWTMTRDRETGRLIPSPTPLANGPCPRWAYDLAYDAVRTVESGRYVNGRAVERNDRGAPRYLPSGSAFAVLRLPAWGNTTLSTGELYKRFAKLLPDAWPFSFFSVLHPFDSKMAFLRKLGLAPLAATDPGRYEYLCDLLDDLVKSGTTFILPRVTQESEVQVYLARGQVYRADNGEALPPEIDPPSMFECLEAYFLHGEHKTADPYGVGLLPMRHVVVTGLRACGKEMNRRTDLVLEDTEGLITGEREEDTGEPADFGLVRDPASRLAHMLQSHDVRDVALISGCSERTAERVKQGDKQAGRGSMSRVIRNLPRLDPVHPRSLAGWREVGHHLHYGPLLRLRLRYSNVQMAALWSAGHRWTDNERDHLADVLAMLRAERTVEES